MVKAISLWQPWATLCVIGAKQYETRSWYTGIRGRVYIHAAKKWDRNLRETALDEPFACALAGIPGVDVADVLPLGALIGTVEIADCLRVEAVRETISERERAFGDYYDGRFAWRLANPVRFAEPIPYRGSQGFFDVEDPRHE